MTKRTAAFLFVALIFVWGINWSVVKLAVAEVPPIWTAALRCSLAAAFLFIVQSAAHQFIIPQRHDVRIILIIGIFHIAATCFFMAIGLQFVGAGRSAVLGYTTPLWVVPAAWLFLKEPLPPMRLAGTLLGICGLLVLCNPGALDWSDGKVLWGHFLLLLSALCWTVAIIGIRKHRWLATPFQLIFWQTLLASCLLIVVACAWEGPPTFSLSTRAVLLLLYAGIPATAGGFWAMTVINRILPATMVSLSSLATPVAGILFSVILLKETIDLPLAIATSLILGGIALGILWKPRAK